MNKNNINEFLPFVNENSFIAFVVEDSFLLRSLIFEILRSIEGVCIVGFAENEDEALNFLKKTVPHLILMDLELKSGTGLGILQKIDQRSKEFEKMKRVIFSNHTDQIIKYKCKQLGANAFFDKSLQLDEMVDYVQNEMVEFKEKLSKNNKPLKFPLISN